jgi:hypothetical protein
MGKTETVTRKTRPDLTQMRRPGSKNSARSTSRARGRLGSTDARRGAHGHPIGRQQPTGGPRARCQPRPWPQPQRKRDLAPWLVKTILIFPERSHRRSGHSLADRMFSRGISALSPLNREIRRDMVTCSGCLRRLAIDNPGGVDVDI